MDKIELIFNMYKDNIVVSKPFKQEMIRRYKLSDEDIRNLYIRIQNYQIATYGNRLTYTTDVYSKEDLRKIGKYSASRKYSKKNPRENQKLSLDDIFGNVMEQVDDLCRQAKELSH